MRLRLNPITRKRLRAFRRMKRAHVSFWLLMGLYGLSLIANLLLSDVPLYVRYDGRSYFPILRYYPDSTFTGGDRQTRPDYKALNRSARFADNDADFMVFPPFPFGPNEIIPPEAIDIPDVVTIRIARKQYIGSLNLSATGTVTRSTAAAALFGFEQDRDLRDVPLTDLLVLPPNIEAAIADRFANRARPEISAKVTAVNGSHLDVSLSPYAARSSPPATVRITVREVADPRARAETMAVGPDGAILDPPPIWSRLSESEQARVMALAASRFVAAVQPDTVTVDGVAYTVAFEREDVTYPFRPVRAHPLGLDSSGRDVLVQIVYATRISMSFGFVLVISTMVIGIVMGSLQGYYGGAVDVIGQRLIEIWSALPFLYVMILLGSVYGRSFGLLLVCYGMFNWIGISYYIRAEFLKLRSQPFVEAANVLGLPQRTIIFRHVLPNGLVPVITFFPFSLVGAIGSLAALDYLGFGLPPPTPSWGALLSQGQEFRFAWWLVLYPSVTLFIVILLGVFIGEGVRAAYDPRHDARME